MHTFSKIIISLFLLVFTGSCTPNGSETKADIAETTDTADARAIPTDLPLHKIKLPAGFKIELYADKVKGARSMALSPEGTLFVGTRDDKVYAITDANKDFIGDEVITIAEGLNSPNGVAFKDGSLYVAEISRILRFDDIEKNLENPPKPVVVYSNYPDDDHHGWKFIAFGPDEKLYVPVGAPCNICKSEDPVYATITRLNKDGSGFEIFAEGIRNTVGFDWHPQTGELWFTDNGGDRLGDNIPPDELNHAPEKGIHFGYPYCHGGDYPDPDYGKQFPCGRFAPPAQKLGPHVAALGMRFYTGEMFPGEYKNQIFIAEHGSWNRSVPIGYRVTMVELEGNKAVSYRAFAEGWLDDNGDWGRPVDVQQLYDGSLLVSDDKADVIYRISYKE